MMMIGSQAEGEIFVTPWVTAKENAGSEQEKDCLFCLFCIRINGKNIQYEAKVAADSTPEERDEVLRDVFAITLRDRAELSKKAAEEVPAKVEEAGSNDEEAPAA